MDLLNIIREIGAPAAAVQLRYGSNYVYKLLSGGRTASREVLARAQRVWPEKFDVQATLRVLHPDWTPDRVAAEARAVIAIALIPSDASGDAA